VAVIKSQTFHSSVSAHPQIKKDYKMKSSKFLEALKVPLNFLKIAGLWDCESVKRKRKVQQFCAHLLFCEVFISLQIIYLFTAKNLVDITKLISILLSCVGLAIKSIHMLKERKAIEALIKEAKELAKLIQTDDEKPLEALNRRSNQIKSTFNKILMFGPFAVTVYVINMIVTNVIGSYPSYTTPYRVWLPFDFENNVFGFSFVTIYQITVALVTYTLLISLDTLPLIFINVGAGFLEELGERLSKVCDEGKEDIKAMKEFEKCIAIHIKIKRFVRNIEMRFSSVICAQGSMSLVILSTAIFQLSKVSF
jgi:7tm Odorant receptor